MGSLLGRVTRQDLVLGWVVRRLVNAAPGIRWRHVAANPVAAVRGLALGGKNQNCHE